jgi:uncharacterized membrane protein
MLSLNTAGDIGLNKFVETQWRAITKVLTWRVLLTLVNFTYTYVVTGDWKAGLAVAGLAAIFNSFIYWSHERVWNKISWGKNELQS